MVDETLIKQRYQIQTIATRSRVRQTVPASGAPAAMIIESLELTVPVCDIGRSYNCIC